MKVGAVGLWHLGSVTAPACTATTAIMTVRIEMSRSISNGLSRAACQCSSQGYLSWFRTTSPGGPLLNSDLAGIEAEDVFWVCGHTRVDDQDQADVEGAFRKIRAPSPPRVMTPWCWYRRPLPVRLWPAWQPLRRMRAAR
jgi:hypothetical protein